MLLSRDDLRPVITTFHDKYCVRENDIAVCDDSPPNIHSVQFDIIDVVVVNLDLALIGQQYILQTGLKFEL